MYQAELRKEVYVLFIIFANLMVIFAMNNVIVICRKNSWRIKNALILDS